MKWTNKGHEYDEMYKNIEKKEQILFIWSRRLWTSVSGDVQG